MTNSEDRQFLIMQRKDVISFSIAGVDRNLAEKKMKKRARTEAKQSRRLKQAEKLQQIETFDLALDITSSFKSEVEDNFDDENFRVSSSSSAQTLSTSKPKQLKIAIATPEVAQALDRVNLRGAMYVVTLVTKALGHPLDNLTLSRSTIRRSININAALVINPAPAMCYQTFLRGSIRNGHTSAKLSTRQLKKKLLMRV